MFSYVSRIIIPHYGSATCSLIPFCQRRQKVSQKLHSLCRLSLETNNDRPYSKEIRSIFEWTGAVHFEQSKSSNTDMIIGLGPENSMIRPSYLFGAELCDTLFWYPKFLFISFSIPFRFIWIKTID